MSRLPARYPASLPRTHPHPRHWNSNGGPGSESATPYAQVRLLCVQTNQLVFWWFCLSGAREADAVLCVASAGARKAYQPLAQERSAEGAPSPTSISYPHQPDAQREGGSLLEEHSPCKAIFLPVTDFRNGDQKEKAPGACLCRLGCLATKRGPDSRREF